MNRKVFEFQSKPGILSSCAVGGRLEKEGPLGSYFDITETDTTFGMESWEKAETKMVEICSTLALEKAKVAADEIDLVFAGDLMNQCTASSFAFRQTQIPYIGLYGACSTFALSLGLAAMSLETGFAKRTMAVASSHFCSAERQYRFPIEYGNQRTPTSQNTVTGVGAVILGEQQGERIAVTEFLPGRIHDYKIKDVNNMGAAMAPAALYTLKRYFSFSDKKPEDFDLIVTGDLGMEGKNILIELGASHGLILGENYNDCGVMIYDLENQDVHAGGSGCGCSASVFSGYLMDQLRCGNLNDILLVGTGALLSPTTALQKESIPGIAHLVRIQRVK